MCRDIPRRRVLRGVLLLAAAVGAAGCGGPVTSPAISGARPTSTPSLPSVLTQSWHGFRSRFIEADGRVIDPKRGGITTSEGQSYGMLRAAWMGDRSTFDTVWGWTQRHLQVRGDGVFASLWASGSGVQDRNSASDADSDIALALIIAARRFTDPGYTASARTVLAGVWSADVAEVAGMRVLTGGNWATLEAQPVVNPSYFAPYAYRAFAAADPAHPWNTLVDGSYTVLERCTVAPLDSGHSAGLPPNWCALRRSDGAALAYHGIAGADQYGYDAFRVMWRVALDAIWNNESRARDYLQRHDFLRQRWNSSHRLDAVYGHDGSVVQGHEDPGVYGGDIGSFVTSDSTAAKAIQAKLIESFHAGSPAYFGDPDNYYEQNWVWFGLALAGGMLSNPTGGGQ